MNKTKDGSKNTMKVTGLADIAAHCERLGEILREHYPVVVCTGIVENTRPPHAGKWRGYYTVVVEDDDDE